MNISGGWAGGREGGGGGRWRGYHVILHFELSLFFPGALAAWMGGGDETAGQKDQRALKVKIKMISIRVMHTLLFLCTVVMDIQPVQLCSWAKWWQNVWNGGGARRRGWRRQVYLSWQMFQFLFAFLLHGPKAQENSGQENLQHWSVDSRQPLSSLLSKQSGNPSHCHPPGTHFPSAHMKFPGMLHSVVTLLPGSSWPSDGGEGNRSLPTSFQTLIIFTVGYFTLFHVSVCVSVKSAAAG